jgi:ubiquitin conjugation factor E4 B
LNDATFVLDEALTKFPKIHELQQQLRSPPGVLTEEERATKQEELATAESQAQSYMQLTNETVSMMKLFTKTLSTSFTMPEIVDRVAAMLDYTLETLVGPKSSTLQVDDKKKYHFEPKTLLCEFIDIYFNLSVSENFINAVAGDGRCYKPKTFADASFIIQKYNLKSSQEVADWEKLSNRFRVAKEMEDQDEDDLGEPPDDFVDPITATLMSDPVILPTSKQTVDRSTIRSILLSDPLDPFNRAPLKIEDVIDDKEMKTKIEEWKKEMRANAVKARMDTIDAAGD